MACFQCKLIQTGFCLFLCKSIEKDYINSVCSHRCMLVCVRVGAHRDATDTARLFIAEIKACIFADACRMINVSVET